MYSQNSKETKCENKILFENGFKNKTTRFFDFLLSNTHINIINEERMNCQYQAQKNMETMSTGQYSAEQQ